MVFLEHTHPRSHSRFATCMHFHLPLFSILTKDNSKCFWVSNGINSLVSILYSHEGLDLHFPILSFSLWSTFALSPFSILRAKYSSLDITSFSPSSILNSQHSVLFCLCYSPFSCLALILINFIVFDSRFWMHQHFLLFLFSILSINFISHTTKLFSLFLFSILMSDHESLDAILYSHA